MYCELFEVREVLGRVGAIIYSLILGEQVEDVLHEYVLERLGHAVYYAEESTNEQQQHVHLARELILRNGKANK